MEPKHKPMLYLPNQTLSHTHPDRLYHHLPERQDRQRSDQIIYGIGHRTYEILCPMSIAHPQSVGVPSVRNRALPLVPGNSGSFSASSVVCDLPDRPPPSHRYATG